MYLQYFLTSIIEIYKGLSIAFSSENQVKKFLSRIIQKKFTKFEKFLKAILLSQKESKYFLMFPIV